MESRDDRFQCTTANATQIALLASAMDTVSYPNGREAISTAGLKTAATRKATVGV
jgi:hypothetical protein